MLQLSIDKSYSMKSKGYTLIEILVTTTIMVILQIAIEIIARAINTWSRSSGKLSTFSGSDSYGCYYKGS